MMKQQELNVNDLTVDEASDLYDKIEEAIWGSSGASGTYNSALERLYTLPVNSIFGQKFDDGDQNIFFDELRTIAAVRMVTDPKVFDRLAALDGKTGRK